MKLSAFVIFAAAFATTSTQGQIQERQSSSCDYARGTPFKVYTNTTGFYGDLIHRTEYYDQVGFTVEQMSDVNTTFHLGVGGLLGVSADPGHHGHDPAGFIGWEFKFYPPGPVGLGRRN